MGLNKVTKNKGIYPDDQMNYCNLVFTTYIKKLTTTNNDNKINGCSTKKKKKSLKSLKMAFNSNLLYVTYLVGGMRAVARSGQGHYARYIGLTQG